LQQYLEDTFPDLNGKITGDNYPAPPIVELLVKVLSGVQLLTMALVIFGDGLWTNVLRFRRVPAWYYRVKEYGFQFGVAIFFVIPQILGNWMKTGAFEIMADDQLIFSKLEMKRLPGGQEIKEAFERLGLVAAGST
jgi:selT/selW/selH-like putative selenoprotein